jgi:hypothetical protein
MPYTLTIVDENARPIPAGLGLVLLGDGAPLAKGTVGAGGVVTFDVSAEGVKRLAVRGDVEIDAPRSSS